MDGEVKKGSKSYKVEVILMLELEIMEVESEEEARRITNTLEAKVSPWAKGHTDIVDWNTDIETVEPLEL